MILPFLFRGILLPRRASMTTVPARTPGPVTAPARLPLNQPSIISMSQPYATTQQLLSSSYRPQAIAAETKKPIVKVATVNGTARQQGDGPLQYSLRPNKVIIETLVIFSALSPATATEPWNQIDDVRLIRLKKCRKLKWPEIKSHFPGRANDAAEKRYSYYLRKSRA
jgi:hypothetical protein